MTIPLVGRVGFIAELAFFNYFAFLLFFSFTFLAILDRVILFDIAAKSKQTLVNKRDETLEKDRGNTVRSKVGR